MSGQVLVLSKEELTELIKSTVAEALAENQLSIRKSTPVVYLTRKEAKDVLRTTYPTLQKHTDSGLLKCENFGRKKLYSQEELNLAIPRFRSIQGNRRTKERIAS